MTDDVITKVSDNGEVALPEAVLERQHWDPGTRLIVEETADGVLLKPAPAFAPTPQGSAFGMLRYSGKPKTIEEMEQGILDEARRSFLQSVDPNS